jgi:hypothetical protein
MNRSSKALFRYVLVYFFCTLFPFVQIGHSQDTSALRFVFEDNEPISASKIFFIGNGLHGFKSFKLNDILYKDSLKYSIYQSDSLYPNLFRVKEELSIEIPNDVNLKGIDKVFSVNQNYIGLLNDNSVFLAHSKTKILKRILFNSPGEHFEDAISLNDSVVVIASSAGNSKRIFGNKIRLFLIFLESNRMYEFELTDFGDFKSFVDLAGSNRLMTYKNYDTSYLIVSSRLQPLVYRININRLIFELIKSNNKTTIDKEKSAFDNNIDTIPIADYAWIYCDSSILDSLLSQRQPNINWYGQMSKTLRDISFIKSIHMLNDSILGIFVHMNDSFSGNKLLIYNVRNWRKIEDEMFYEATAGDTESLSDDVDENYLLKMMNHFLTFPSSSFPIDNNGRMYFLDRFEFDERGIIIVIYMGDLCYRLGIH